MNIASRRLTSTSIHICKLFCLSQAQLDIFTIELTKSYGMVDWHDDMKRLLISCGGKQKEVCFLLADTQIANENFVEETSGLLNNGEIPNLFNAEDKTIIGELCTQRASAEGRHGPAEVLAGASWIVTSWLTKQSSCWGIFQTSDKQPAES